MLTPDAIMTALRARQNELQLSNETLEHLTGICHGGVDKYLGPAQTKTPTLALRGSFEGEENVVEADATMVATVNTLIISNAQNQVYAHDHSFKFMREDPAELGSGATLVQDK